MTQPKKNITDLSDSDYNGKRVLVRADLNVPMNPDGTVASDYRIVETLPTIQYLLDRQAKVIIVTHMGRPKGAPEDKYRLKPVVEALRKHLPEVTVNETTQCIGPEVTAAVNQLQPGQILVLENIRFEPGETKNDPELSKQLAALADIYVNDAFGTAHRAHASTEGVAHYVPVKVAGLLMRRELAALSNLMSDSEKPFTAIVGGSKVSTKIEVLTRLLASVNNLVIGGGMAYTFLKAKGYAIGTSLVEDDYVETAKSLMKDAEQHDTILILPTDLVVANQYDPNAEHKVVPSDQIPDGWMGLDTGPDSAARICEVIQNSKTVFWNGPIGVFEFPAFAKGTQTVAECLAKCTKEDHLTSVLGGGDTQSAIEQFKIPMTDFTHVSTGGGASMELLEGKDLPGVDILEDKIPQPVS